MLEPSKPVIAAVNGDAVAGELELAIQKALSWEYPVVYLVCLKE